MKRWIVRSIIAALLLTVLQAIAGAALLRGVSAPQGNAVSLLAWSLLSNLLTAAVAVALATRFAVRGAKLAAALFVVLFGIPANYLAESFFFDIGVGAPTLGRLYAYHLVLAAFLAMFVAWQLRSEDASDRRRPIGAGALTTRIVIVGCIYLVAYFVAGFIAFPFISAYYAGRAMPPVGELALIQLARGMAFSAVGAVIVASTAASRNRIALSVGLTLSILGGIAPLIVPNAFMPASVRLVHLVEVGVSNFLVGLCCGALLSARNSR